MRTVVVGGALANKPLNGGEAWVRLSWVLGLKKLGFDVLFVEQIDRPTCVDARGAVTPFEDSVNLAYFRQVTEGFGLTGSAALVFEEGEQIEGLGLRDLFERAEAAELLVNISGHLTWGALLDRLRRKAYVDIDPGFTQFWHDAGRLGSRLADHDVHITIGENIGTSACPIPTGGLRWLRTRQPVVLEHWPEASEREPDRFTTVASWRGAYGPVEHRGTTYGLKVHQFRNYIALPERVGTTFEIALSIHPADHKDLEALRRHGWRIVDPREVAPDPWAFRRYVQASGAEFSVAQGIYVETWSGWFSDRTVRYLASGKPALVQETGFSAHLPVGEGLVAFRTLDEAVDGAERIARDYDRHCRAARRLAEEFFDSDRVLGALLQEIEVAP